VSLPIHPIFDQFEPWSGEVDAGWTVNFLGVRTRDEFSVGMTGTISSERRHVQTHHPRFDEEYFEWIDLLEAVARAVGVFTMIELGAGWGRWLMNGAAAAARRGIPVHLVGVEAEPTHFRWMKQHFKDNGVHGASLRLIDAAVAAEGGRVRFHVGDPSAWYGQAIDPNEPRPGPKPALLDRLRSLVRRPRTDARSIVEVRAITLASILQDLERVDLIDLDVQGAEADVLESSADKLCEQVNRVHIGTHSAENEQRLRTLFGRLEWEKVNDYPCAAESETPWSRISFQDGVQTWVNTRLSANAP